MGYIDCDAHVYENDRTWDYLDPSERHYRPVTLRNPDTGTEAWIVGDMRFARNDHLLGYDEEKFAGLYPPGAVDLSDVPARLAHMDKLGIDVQIVFSTFFNSAGFARPLVEAALARSWNRWMGDSVADSGGRLRWSLRAPVLMLDRAFQEMEFGKEHGATGIHMRGMAAGMVLDDEYLYPFYARAQDLDLVINVHVGFLDLTVALRDPRSNIQGITQIIVGFHRLALGDLHDRFPRLRWSFLEAGASWLPFALQETARGTGIGLRRPDDNTTIDRDLLWRKNLYVACQIEDDLPYLLRYAADSNLIVGTDYGHLDIGSDLGACALTAGRPDLDPLVARKITDHNGRRLHGIDPSFLPSSRPL
jgi:uncharacterized protein